MRSELLYNPRLIVERLALESYRYRRLTRLKNTVAKNLKLGHIDSLEFLDLISSEDIKVIYDIGANIGTWSLLAKAIFPNSIIHAFEPLKIHYGEFKKNMQDIEEVTLHPVALGSTSQRNNMNIASFSDASSLLEIARATEEHFKVYKASEEEVVVVTLDEYQKRSQIPLPDLIKLDIQGYELEALKGAINCLEHTKFIICEVSFIEFYKNQPLFEDITCFLDKKGFSIYALGVNTPLGKRLTQTDVMYINNNFKDEL